MLSRRETKVKKDELRENSGRKFTKNLRKMLEETRRSITIMSTKASKMETDAVKGSLPKDLWTEEVPTSN